MRRLLAAPFGIAADVHYEWARILGLVEQSIYRGAR